MDRLFFFFIRFCPGPARIRSCILGKTKTILKKYSDLCWFKRKTDQNHSECHSELLRYSEIKSIGIASKPKWLIEYQTVAFKAYTAN